MNDKIKEVLERAEPCPDRVSKSDRIIFYQKQLADIAEFVGVATTNVVKKSVKRVKKKK